MSEAELPSANQSRLSGELTAQFLKETLDASRSAETQFREFAAEVYDDEEVQRLFTTVAERTRAQRSRLAGHFEQLTGLPVGAEGRPDPALKSELQPAHPGNVPEERTLQNLIAGYAIASGASAMYEVLAAVAGAAGDNITKDLAQESAAEQRASADQIWHFLPSRSKIAFNMLTISEVDPSVETKVADNRLLES